MIRIFCLWMYVVVDELWRQLPPAESGAGTQRQRVDHALVGECWLMRLLG